jgi:hypothetical protein
MKKQNPTKALVLEKEIKSYKVIASTKYILLEDGNIARILKKHKRCGRNYLFLRFDKRITKCLGEDAVAQLAW